MEAVFSYVGSMNSFAVFGLLSGLLSAYAYIPYIADTASGQTQPQRASWLIWSILGSIAFFSQLQEGAGFSLWFAGAQVLGTIVVFVLSIRSGTGTYLKPSDYIILVIAGVGLVLWYFTETATYALLITISISLLGGTATVLKAYKEPKSETITTWVVSLLASVCALLSVGKADLILMAYPLYLFTLYSAITLAMLIGKKTPQRSTNTIRPAANTLDIRL